MVAGVAVALSYAVVVGCQPVEGPRKETRVDDGGESVVVATSLGQVRGVRESGVLHFRGMRYAEPPTGERRFLAPLASGAWAENLDATRLPSRCVQPDNGLPGAPPGTPTSEDCLFLNIVTPSVTGAQRPVLFWIHGGGFTNGSANEYNGSVLAAQGDVVVVTINYRLGLFGFLDLGSLGAEFAGSASNGIRDQVLALEWVRDNIADYGGDPGSVTIFGESAGGHSVHALLATPAADGLYHKAIAHSPGTADQPPTDLVTPLLAQLGESREGLVDALRGMTAEDLLAMQATLPSVGARVDGTVVTRATDAAIVERGARGVPLIAGTNRDEGTFFTALFTTFVPEAAAQEQMIAGMNPGLARAVVAGKDPAPYLDALNARYPDADAKQIQEHICSSRPRWVVRRAPLRPGRAGGCTGSTCRQRWISSAKTSAQPTVRRFLSRSTGSTAMTPGRWFSTTRKTPWCATCPSVGRTPSSPSRELASPTGRGCRIGRATTAQAGRPWFSTARRE